MRDENNLSFWPGAEPLKRILGPVLDLRDRRRPLAFLYHKHSQAHGINIS
jgi:hypothetical protein